MDPKLTITEERRIALERLRHRVIQVQDKLINAQLSLALGASWLYRIDIDDKGNRMKPKLVTDDQEVKDYLSDMYDRTTSEYYMIFTDKPDIKAIDSLLDRALGRPESMKPVEEEQQELGVIAYPVREGETLVETDTTKLLTEPVYDDKVPLEATSEADTGVTG